MPDADDDAAFQRGKAAGEITERLREHDRHFDRLNGSLERFAGEMAQLTLAVQRVSDTTASQATAATAAALALKEADAVRRESVNDTAAALRAADKVRREAAQRTWGAYQKLFAVLAGLAAIATVIAVIISLASAR